MEQSAIAIARNQANIDKAPRLCIRVIIWILPSDICQLNKNISKYWDGNAIQANKEAKRTAMCVFTIKMGFPRQQITDDQYAFSYWDNIFFFYFEHHMMR